MTAWTTGEALLLEQLRDTWGGVYDIGFADGEYHAFRVIGGQPFSASTIGALESAIRADWARWGAQ